MVGEACSQGVSAVVTASHPENVSSSDQKNGQKSELRWQHWSQFATKPSLFQSEPSTQPQPSVKIPDCQGVGNPLKKRLTVSFKSLDNFSHQTIQLKDEGKTRCGYKLPLKTHRRVKVTIIVKRPVQGDSVYVMYKTKEKEYRCTYILSWLMTSITT